MTRSEISTKAEFQVLHEKEIIAEASSSFISKTVYSFVFWEQIVPLPSEGQELEFTTCVLD
jgi:hypothetical protein